MKNGMNSEEVKRVSEALRTLRARTGETQEQVAEAIGATHVSIGRYESGARMPTPGAVKKLAEHFGVPSDFILGKKIELEHFSNAYAIAEKNMIPIVGSIKCGANGIATQEIEGYALSEYDPESHFMLRAYGDSMEPDIHAGDLVVIHRQEDVESGDIAAVYIIGEGDAEGTLKKVIKQKDAITLVPLNSTYQPYVFFGTSVSLVKFAGKVVEVRHKL